MNAEARLREHAEMMERSRDIWEPLRGERIFITGGTGFVGTWLMEALVAANEAFALDARAVILTRNPERVRQRTPELFDDSALTYIGGEMTSFAQPTGTFAFVIHAATEKPFAADAERPYSVIEPDFAATRRVLDFARDHGTKRFLFTSSGAMYGRQPPEMSHISEEYLGGPDISNPSSAYGESKRVSEFACFSYARTAAFDAVVTRLFAFVGPYLPLDEGFAVGNFIGDVLAKRPIAIGGDGTPYRSYLYAADLAVWLWTILLRGTSGRVYNVGSDEGLSIRELAERVGAVLNVRDIRVAQQADAGRPPMRYVPSVARAADELGLRPWTSLDEGIRRTFDASTALAGRTFQ
jgi:dTDP-glucose 4,6-dehydratase